jgi:hypothetical protein
VGFVQAEGRQKQGFGRGQAFESGFACNHQAIVGGRPSGRVQDWTNRRACDTDISIPIASPSVTMAVPP